MCYGTVGQETDVDSSNVAVSTVSEIVVGGAQPVARSPHMTSMFTNAPYFYPSTLPHSNVQIMCHSLLKYIASFVSVKYKTSLLN